MYITISAKATEPRVVYVEHNDELVQTLELPYDQRAPEDDDYCEQQDLDEGDVPDSYGTLPGLRLPKGIFAIAAYRGKRLLFVLVCGPGFVTKCGRDDVLTAVADAEHRIREKRTIQQVVSKLPGT